MMGETIRVSGSAFRIRILGLWERVLRLSRRAPRRLRLCESLPLGERRFVAVVEFEAARFLVGGTASSMVLLSRLADAVEGTMGDRGEERDEELESACEEKSEPKAWSRAVAMAGKRQGGIC